MMQLQIEHERWAFHMVQPCYLQETRLFFSFRHCEVGQVIEQLDRDGSGAFDISESLGTVENLGDFISCFADVMVEDYVDLEI